MKKWFATILLLIALASSVIPCCQTEDRCSEEISSQLPGAPLEDDGNCSPFFSCTTCPGFTHISKLIQLPQPAVQKQIHFNTVLVSPLPDYIARYWQPPRFS